MDSNNLKVKPRNRLHRIAWLVLLVAGGLAFWLVVLRIVVKLHGGESCPFALAWIVDNPLFLVTVLPEIPDRHWALVELNRVLKRGGVLSITEEFLDPDYPLARTTVRRAREAGFGLAQWHGHWFVYALNSRKPA